MENKSLDEIEKEYLIIQNKELFKILVLLCRGCCLQQQLRDILLKTGVYKNPSDFYRAMAKLKDKGLIVTKKFSKTNNYIVFPSRFAFAKVSKKEKKQVNVPTQNIYDNRKLILTNLFKLEHLLQFIEKEKIEDINNLFKYINKSSLKKTDNQGDTYLYNLVKNFDEGNTKIGKEVYLKMQERAENSKANLINNRTKRNELETYVFKESEEIETVEIEVKTKKKKVDYNTLLSRKIYIIPKGTYFDIYMFDINNKYNARKVGDYIRDTHDLIDDTLKTNTYTKYNFYVCVQNEFMKKNLEKELWRIKQIAKTGGYITNSDFIEGIENITISILDFELQKKYFNGQNLVGLIG